MNPIDHAQMAADRLKMAFDHAAKFRRECVREAPEIGGNREAVMFFENLAATIEKCSMPDLRTWADLNVYDDTARTDEVMQEMLKSVGFSYWPESASVFVRDFIARNVH